MEDLNVPIFAQAKIEYTNQLVDILYPHMYDGIKSIYDESKVIYVKKTGTPILLLFRELLEKVPIWNSEIVESECSRITNNSNCDWIDDLITAVFISHTKILTSIGPNQSFHKINVTIPKTVNFIHKTYINIAREIWKNPYLFNESVPGHEYQRNSKEVEIIIKQCIESTIRHLLPIKEILREHLDVYETDNILNNKDELKQMLKEELKELKNELKSSNTPKGDKDNLDDEDDMDDMNDMNDMNDDEEGSDKKKTDLEDDVTNPDESVTDAEKELLKREEELLKQEEEFLRKQEEELLRKQEEELKDELSSLSKQIYISDKNDDPSEEQISQQCDNIVVNDITIPVEDESSEVKELLYDNANILSEEEDENSKNDRIKEIFSRIDEEIIEEKPSEEITNELHTNDLPKENEPPKVEQPSQFTLNGIFNSGENKEQGKEQDKLSITNENDVKVSKVEEPKIEEPKTEEPKTEEPKTEEPKTEEPKTEEPKTEEPKTEEPKTEEPTTGEIKPIKEIVTITNDIDETSSLANFFQDMKEIVETKGINVEDNKDFVLFEDASEIESK